VWETELRERLKAGYQANAQENLQIALEWFPLEEAEQPAFYQGAGAQISERVVRAVRESPLRPRGYKRS
jgi:hypothetical protein